MRPESLACLSELQRAIGLIRSALANVTESSYEGDWEKQSAVERQLIVIGESLVRIRSLEPSLLEAIPDAVGIIGLRNLLVHGYDAVDALTIYSLCQEPLTVLLVAIDTLLPNSALE